MQLRNSSYKNLILVDLTQPLNAVSTTRHNGRCDYFLTMLCCAVPDPPVNGPGIFTLLSVMVWCECEERKAALGISVVFSP